MMEMFGKHQDMILVPFEDRDKGVPSIQEITDGAEKLDEVLDEDEADMDDERDFDGVTVAQSIADAGLEYPHLPDFILQPCPIATDGHFYCFNPPPEHYPSAFEKGHERLQMLPPKEQEEQPTPRTARKMLFGLQGKSKSSSALKKNPSGSYLANAKKNSTDGKFLPGLGPSSSNTNLEKPGDSADRAYAEDPADLVTKPKKKKAAKPNPRTHVMSNALYWARATSGADPPAPTKARPPPTFFSLKFPPGMSAKRIKDIRSDMLREDDRRRMDVLTRQSAQMRQELFEKENAERQEISDVNDKDSKSKKKGRPASAPSNNPRKGGARPKT